MGLDMALRGLLSTVASSVYAAYALAERFTVPEYWVSGTQYSPITALPGYSFTRSGTQGAVDASGAVQFFAPNVAAINSAGYHAYGALTNLLLRSHEFDNASWSKSGMTSTANTTVAPDGTTTADTVATNATGARTFQGVTLASGVVHTQTFIVKKGTAAFAAIRFLSFDSAADTVWFNLTTQAVATKQAGVFNAYVVPMTGGFVKLVATFSTTTDLIGEINLYLTDVDAAFNVTVGHDIYVWYAGILAGNFPDGGPIITTTTAAVGIGASALSNTDTVTSADMLFWATVDRKAARLDNQMHALWSAGAATNRVELVSYNTDGYVQVEVAGVLGYNGFGAIPLGLVTLVAQRVGGNWRGGYVKLGAITWFGAAAAGAFPAGMNTVNAGCSVAGLFQSNDPVKGVHRKIGTFSSDANVLAAVAETT